MRVFAGFQDGTHLILQIPEALNNDMTMNYRRPGHTVSQTLRIRETLLVDPLPNLPDDDDDKFFRIVAAGRTIRSTIAHCNI